MHPSRSVRHTALVAVVAVGGLIVVELFGRHYAWDNLRFFIAVRTAETLIGLIAAFLFYGRYRRRQRLDDLVLSTGFGILALNNLFFGAIPAIAGEDPSRLAVWASTVGTLLGAMTIAGAALLRPRRFALGRMGLATAMFLPLALLGVVAAVLAAIENELPQAVVATPSGSDDLELNAHWLIVVAEAVLCMLFLGAAVRFAARAERENEHFFSWLAIGVVLSAAARLTFVSYPSVHSVLFSTGDALRLAFYLVVLVGALQEISSYWASLADVAALRERRRLARDIHDVLAQDIASIGRNLRWLDDGDPHVQRARAAADRALLETRGALAALTERSQQPLRDLVDDIARKVGEREGIVVVVEAEGDIDADTAQGLALAMIASEAITNAARHGHASVVRVELRGGRGVSMRIADAGEGFQPSEDGTGYGLATMRERAEAMGAELRVCSEPGRGTEILVTL